jgi:nicotinamidase-related amidase
MQALLVVDAQNEFSATGLRPVPNHDAALAAIHRHAAAARREGHPIAWIRHHNRPEESRAFIPGSWGAELSPGMGPQRGHGAERLFEKDVYGAFTNTGLEAWLRGLGATAVLIVGFYAHMCLSTSVREALVRGFDVAVDPDATGACDLHDAPWTTERQRRAPHCPAPARAHGRDDCDHGDGRRVGRYSASTLRGKYADTPQLG